MRKENRIIHCVWLYPRDNQQRFDRPEENPARACEQHPRIKAYMGRVHPVMEIVERVDWSGHERREKEEVVEISQEIPGAESPLITFNQPVNYTEQNVRQTDFLHREEVLV